MRHHFAILMYATGVLSTIGCASVPKTPTVAVVPQVTQKIELALTRAQMCASPVLAKEKLDRNFKYGCFCGAGYPGLKHASGKSEGSLTSAERQELITAYYAIKPKDSIDAACQAHDICWLMHGRPELACNVAFKATLQSLEKRWNSRRGWFDYDRFEFRCAYLARDLSFAADTVMEGVSGDTGEKMVADLTRATTLPLTTVYALLTATSGLILENYPFASDVCANTR